MSLFGKKSQRPNRKRPSTPASRRLSFEMLEQRSMLAITNMGAIAGTVYDDLTGNGFTGDDQGMANVAVQLYLSNSGNVFNINTDTLVSTTSSDSGGHYRFDGLSAGTYFVRQEAPAGFHQLPGGDIALVTISAQQAAGSQGLTIDSFDQTESCTSSAIVSRSMRKAR